MPRSYLPVYHAKAKCLLFIGGMLFIYLLDNLSVSKYIGYAIYTFLIKPMLWIALTVIIRVLPASRPKSPLKLRENIYHWAFILAAINLIISMAGGLIDGFGKSPYSHTFTGILLNVLMVGSMLTGREAARDFIVNHLTQQERFSVFITISLLTTMLGYPVYRFTALKSGEDALKFIAQYVAPDFSQNLLATFLAFLGGWMPSLLYMGTLQAFHWLFPVLPNLKWITAALIGMMCPAFSLSALQNIFLKETHALRKSKEKGEGTIGWIITSIVSIGIIWFAVGVFPIYPSVIATGSMEPIIKPGDMLLVEKITTEQEIRNLAEGDIIQFKYENVLISHRIVEVINKDNSLCFRTKGDNNSSADLYLVKPEDTRGKIVYILPKAGWPTLLFKKREERPLEAAEF